MNLATRYLGLELKNPVVGSSSPLWRNLDLSRKFEDAGGAAIVMYSLFEEQLNLETGELDRFLSFRHDTYGEALTYFPEPEDYLDEDADDYLEKIADHKKALDIPVIGSLNGVSVGGWTKFAKRIEEAGADALELNIYYLPSALTLSSSAVEQMYIDDLVTVKKAVSIPVSMKVGPFFTSFANFAKQLVDNGADGLVLFNRFFGPDINLKQRVVVPQLSLSTQDEMRLPLRWIAVLRDQLQCSLAATSGVQTGADLVKMVLAGADVAMFASALLTKGVELASTLNDELSQWMTEHGYESLSKMKGSLSYHSVAEPAAYDRANYMKTLQSWE